MHDELVGSFEFEFEKDGKIELLTDSEIRMLRESPDRETRKRAFESVRKVYLSKTVQITLGNVYTSIVKNWSTKITLRGYSTVMEPQNLSEELDNEVVDLLLKEIENAYPLYARYIKAKQKILGLETMMNYDTMAPISTEETPMPLEDGLKLHLDTMKDFDEEFYNFSIDMFENGRVDAFPKKGKRGGAFASYNKDEPSLVLLNYTGKLSDVPTLSHELGHATHGHLSQVQRDSVYNSGLCLAETASIFSEMLLSEKIRTRLTPEEYTNFLSGELFDAFSSIFRQVQYVLFERKVHETIHSGKELTYHDLNVLWREEQLKMSGDSITFDTPAEEEIGWATIPHIFNSPFYCYAYAFGHLLVFALYDRYRRDGKAFVEDYKNILRAGGSVRPKELLARYGFDITKPEFYRLGLGEIERKLVEFEALANAATP
ncbi:MAG: M3 family metallopeptidase [Patescibacteria group bacterium]